MMQKLLLTLFTALLISNLFADNSVATTVSTSVNLNQEQLSIAQDHIKKEGSAAITAMPKNKAVISNIKLGNLDLTTTNTEITAAQSEFKHIKPLSTSLPSGQKYYLYSESIVSDNKTALAQYTKPPLDINQTISDYNAMIKNSKAAIGENRLLIFISASMPKRTIINLMRQSSEIGAVFVIRGLINGSYVKTYRYLNALKSDNTVGIMINPNLFKYFNVSVAPTFALYQSKDDLFKSSCKGSPIYTKVAGNVTVRYALEQLKGSQNADLAQIATNELNILNHSNFYERSSK